MPAPCKVKLSVILVAVLGSATAPAGEPVDMRIEQAARTALAEHARSAGLKDPTFQVTVLPAGRRQVIGPCTGKVEVQTLDTRSSSRMRFAAVCSEPAWRDERIVRASVSAQVVVASNTIDTRRQIADNDVSMERRDVSNLADAISDLDAVVGKSSRRQLRAGEVIDRRWLVEPILVGRGSIVSISVKQGDIEAQVTGEVLETGRRNDIVHVRNAASGKVILARVLAQDRVEPAELRSP